MTSTRIRSVHAAEILDSRGHPTLEVVVTLAGGAGALASVPSGASTGANEAAELRDGDPQRYSGRGVLKACKSVEGEIAAALDGFDAVDQAGLDQCLIDLDGTPNKARLGANAILGVSMAAARASARAQGQSLFAALAPAGSGSTLLPMPCMNVLNGGKHADSGMDFQEFMIVPVGAPSFAEAMRYGAETYAALRDVLHGKGLATSVGDEGGFAPALESNEAACDAIVEAIEKAGYRPGIDLAIALDPAASSFAVDGGYDLSRSGQGHIDRSGLLALYGRWLDRYPIVSIEDGFAEDDWAGFSDQMAGQGDRIQIVGDDLLVTNPRFIERAIEQNAANALLVKLNQIGTVTEATQAALLAQGAGWKTMVSHRSGETTDDFIADFAVAIAAGQIKSGAPCRGERLAKYNRLMAIEAELGAAAQFINPFS